MWVSQSCSCKFQAQTIQVDQESQGSLGSLGIGWGTMGLFRPAVGVQGSG